jgi:hypothetical protein
VWPWLGFYFPDDSRRDALVVVLVLGKKVEALPYRLPQAFTAEIGELSTDAAKLEVQLSRIFNIVSHWNAILLLDEADVFLEQRSSDLIRNSLVSVFLRKLEYLRRDYVPHNKPSCPD